MIGRILLGTTTLAALVFSAPATAQVGMTNSQKIASAMAAAPSAISANATIMDWPDKSGKQALLRKGTNGWVCMPSEPQRKYLNNDAMCLDKPWQELIGALLSNKKPHLKSVGYGYMLSNDSEEANTRMGDTIPTATNQWHHVHPHVMVVYPNANIARTASSDPNNGGPYVMWKSTPYAHVMWPVK